MNWYRKHIGDFVSATAHLSLVEDGAYNRLIDWYYQDERPLPVERGTIYRKVRARAQVERDAVDAVLAEFFDLRDDGWHQARCDEELERAAEKSGEVVERRANERERQRRHRVRRKELFDALREYGEIPDFDTPVTELETLLSRVASRVTTRSVTPHATAIPVTSNQEPVTSNQDPPLLEKTSAPAGAGGPVPPVPDDSDPPRRPVESSEPSEGGKVNGHGYRPPPCPVEAVVEAFAEVLPELPKPRLTEARRGHIRQRWREWAVEKHWPTQDDGLAEWRKFFTWLRDSPYLMGRRPGTKGRPTFVLDMPWLMDPEHHAEIVDGKFHDA